MEILLDEQHLAVRVWAREAAEAIVAPLARAADEVGQFDRTVIDALAAAGFLGLTTPSVYGGRALDALGLALVYEEMGRADSSVRGFLAVHLGLVCHCIHDWGTDEQLAFWLPGLASGEVLGCYCLTEPGAGSDAASIQTRAELESGTWVIRGEKHWITN